MYQCTPSIKENMTTENTTASECNMRIIASELIISYYIASQLARNDMRIWILAIRV